MIVVLIGFALPTSYYSLRTTYKPLLTTYHALLITRDSLLTDSIVTAGDQGLRGASQPTEQPALHGRQPLRREQLHLATRGDT